MLSKIETLVLFLALLTATWAQSEPQGYMSYDSIVEKLIASTKASQTNDRDPFDRVKIHADLGLVSSHTFIATVDSEHYSGFQKGFEASLGVDLLSPHWIAEAALRSFLLSQLEKGAQASLNEFSFCLLYRHSISQLLKLRLGVGIAARYMKLMLNRASGVVKQDFSTPASILSLGLETAITQTLYINAKLAYRLALITETADSEAIDTTLSLGVHF